MICSKRVVNYFKKTGFVVKSCFSYTKLEVDFIFSFLIFLSIFVLLDFLLFKRISWNLSGFITISLLLKSQLIAISHSVPEIERNSLSVRAKLNNVFKFLKCKRKTRQWYNKPSQLFVEKVQLFNQNKQWINIIIYH